MKRYNNVNIPNTEVFTGKKPTEGKMLEHEVEAMMKNKEPISAGTELIYMRKRDGVLPAYDIRTDAMEQAILAADKITTAAQKKRAEVSKQKDEQQQKQQQQQQQQQQSQENKTE